MPYTLGRFFSSPIAYFQALDRLGVGHWPSPYGIQSRSSPQFRHAARLAYNYLQHRLTRKDAA